MKSILIATLSLVIATIAFSGSPPSNTIPIVAVRPNVDEIDLDLFCTLSWNYFSVLQAGDKSSAFLYNNLTNDAESAGIYLILAPAELKGWVGWPWKWVARIPGNSFSGSTAFARPVWPGVTIDGTTYESNALIKTFYAQEFRDSLATTADTLSKYFGDEDIVWFYNTFDEAPSRQWKHMTRDTVITAGDTTLYLYDDYVPGMFTQERHWVNGDSLPDFVEVEPSGLYSWMKREIELDDSGKTIVSVFALLHDLDWCDEENFFGTFHDQANSVRSFLEAKYQGYGYPTMPVKVDNFPDIFAFDIYPIRQVGVTWATSHGYANNHVSSEANMLLLEHFEEGMDSTFIPVRQTAISQSRAIPVMYYPQAIGRSGGDIMWNSDSTALDYQSYGYRVPTPQEFLMNCNLALMRGAVGLFPYCMMSYTDTNDEGMPKFTVGYLDNNNLPFGAPYEEWVYTDRWTSDYDVIPPDSFPPFSDSCKVCDDFNPLWDLTARPDTVSGSQRTTENYLMWKFSAYGQLWNSMRDTFGQIAVIAPELTQLHWWEGYAECLVINPNSSTSVSVQPEVRFFQNEDEQPYAFYVNRNCFDPRCAVQVTLFGDSLPPGLFLSSQILDHSRRFLLPLERDLDNDFVTFTDTLVAGQGRLVQFLENLNTPADIMITQPDVEASCSGLLSTRDFHFAAETAITVNATFYNMSLQSASDVIVHLKDSTNNTVLDSDTISFSGLPTAGYQCDDQTVSFSWQTDSDDIGLHILKVYADSFTGESNPGNNATTALFQITPRDYAATVLDDPWNMTEVTGSGSPAWHTDDIISMTGWNSTYTDSISGMFEGTISNPNSSNRLELNLGSNSVDYIPTRLYDQFSMIAKADCELTVTVRWEHSGGRTGYLELDTPIDSDWGEIGPFDLTEGSSSWASYDIKELKLEFTSNAYIAPTDVRIGWIKLTE